MSNYIMDLREIVGHRTLIQVGSSVIVVNQKEQILLQKRKDNQCWAYSGGSVEIDENVEDAAKRELFEETGIIANSMELFGIFSGKNMHYIYPNGDEVSIIDIVYICKDYSGEINAQESEVEELCFFDINNLPEQISPPNIIPIKEYINKYAKSNCNN